MGKSNEDSYKLYPEFTRIAGVHAKDAAYEDFQRFFKCRDVDRDNCNGAGLQFPTSCSHPPCNHCDIDRQSKIKNYVECVINIHT